MSWETLPEMWIRCAPGDPSGSLLWEFAKPTRVFAFALRDSSDGKFSSLRVANTEYLIDPMWNDGLPMAALESGALALPQIEVGMPLALLTSGFLGEIRPIGEWLEGDGV